MKNLNLFSVVHLVTPNVHMFGYSPEPEDFIKKLTIEVFHIDGNPESDEFTEVYEKLFTGEYKKTALKVADITGDVIIGDAIFSHSKNFYDICDAYSSDTEFIASVFEELNDKEDMDFSLQNHFLISDFNIDDKFKSQTVMKNIIDNLKDAVLKATGLNIEIALYYPLPLEYEENPYFKIKHDIAIIAHKDMIEKMFGQKDTDTVNLTVDEDQINYLLGRRRSSETYPESAINYVDWNRFTDVGFKEILNSRLLMRYL